MLLGDLREGVSLLYRVVDGLGLQGFDLDPVVDAGDALRVADREDHLLAFGLAQGPARHRGGIALRGDLQAFQLESEIVQVLPDSLGIELLPIGIGTPEAEQLLPCLLHEVDQSHGVPPCARRRASSVDDPIGRLGEG